VVRGPIDNHAAAFALVGMLALLYRRRCTGKGGYIDCSAIEAVTAILGSELLEVQATGREPVRRGNDWPGYLLNDVFPCFGDDQWVAVSIRDDQDWNTFRDVVGIDQQAVDTAVAGAGDTDSAREAVWNVVANRTRHLDANRLEGRLSEHGVPAARSLSLVAARRDPRVAGRGVWQTILHDVIGEQTIVGLPWTVSGHTFDMDVPAPRMGEHGDEIIKDWLGSPSEVQSTGDRGQRRS
jgi:crotonobetainyl-CoA:carnitine CoA-transferase CaiB-like acyl-CoA transferase